MTDIELAWCAGLFEGEGYVRTADNALGLNMTDFDIVQRFHSLIAAGHLYVYESTNPKHKSIMHCRVWKQADIRRLLTAFMPFLGERRAYQASNALDRLDRVGTDNRRKS